MTPSRRRWKRALVVGLFCMPRREEVARSMRRTRHRDAPAVLGIAARGMVAAARAVVEAVTGGVGHSILGELRLPALEAEGTSQTGVQLARRGSLRRASATA